VADEARTPVSTLVLVPTLGLETIRQWFFVQCRMSVSLVLVLTWRPTAQASAGDSGRTPVSKFGSAGTLGLEIIRQRCPFQCRITVLEMG